MAAVESPEEASTTWSWDAFWDDDARNAGTVVANGVRLWLGNWPVLVVIALFGAAGREAALWAAVRVSNVHGTLGILTLALAPLAAVSAVVLMLHRLGGMLPRLAASEVRAAPDDPGTGRRRRLIDVFASVLVPFLAIYASYGYLREDTDRFVNSAVVDELFASADVFYTAGESVDLSRVVFATGWWLVLAIGVALTLRQGLSRLEGRTGWRWLGFVGAYVEVLWLATLASSLASLQDEFWTWAESRRAVAWAATTWDGLVGRLGPLGQPLDTVGGWALGLLGSLDAVVVVPVAWLAAGVVVYGHTLAPPAPTVRRRWWERLPGPALKWIVQVLKGTFGRFVALWNGLRQLARAGLAPMLTFGLAFLLSQRLEDLLALAWRGLVGPQRLDTWLAFSPHVNTVTRALGLTVTVCLLAAAIDRVLARSSSAAGADPAAGHAAREGSSTSGVG